MDYEKLALVIVGFILIAGLIGVIASIPLIIFKILGLLLASWFVVTSVLSISLALLTISAIIITLLVCDTL